jgi:hypothetical protein
MYNGVNMMGVMGLNMGMGVDDGVITVIDVFIGDWLRMTGIQILVDDCVMLQ